MEEVNGVNLPVISENEKRIEHPTDESNPEKKQKKEKPQSLVKKENSAELSKVLFFLTKVL